MSEHIWSTISIGGEIKRELINGLIKAINSDSIDDINLGNICQIKNESDIEAFMDLDGNITFTDDQRSWGEFETLEEFLIKNGIPYDRKNEGSCDFEADIKKWRPGMKEPEIILTNSTFDPVIPASGIKAIMDEYVSLITNNQLFNRLMALLPPEIPELEPFKIVD